MMKTHLLTQRQCKVLDLVVAGKMSKEIAHDLGLSEKTIRYHRSEILQKLCARNVAHLVRMVMIEKMRETNAELIEALQGLVRKTRYSLMEPDPPELAFARAVIAKSAENNAGLNEPTAWRYLEQFKP